MPPSPADVSEPHGDTIGRPADGPAPDHRGGIGLLAAAVLLIEKIDVIEDPDYVPTCSINPVLSCGSVMTSDQAEAFGFPNPILGVAGFAVVLTTGAAMLAGATFRRWYWLGLQAGVTFGVVFVHWLIFQSLYRIGALCPYCMVVWVVTIPLFLFVTLHNVRTGALPTRPRGGACGSSTSTGAWCSPAGTSSSLPSSPSASGTTGKPSSHDPPTLLTRSSARPWSAPLLGHDVPMEDRQGPTSAAVDAVILPGLLAHSGGWDEALFVLLPIGLFGGLLAIANKRAQIAERADEAAPPDLPAEPDPPEPRLDDPAG